MKPYGQGLHSSYRRWPCLEEHQVLRYMISLIGIDVHLLLEPHHHLSHHLHSPLPLFLLHCRMQRRCNDQFDFWQKVLAQHRVYDLVQFLRSVVHMDHTMLDLTIFWSLLIYRICMLDSRTDYCKQN